MRDLILQLSKSSIYSTKPGFHHNLSIPTDNATGKPTGTRQHSPMIIVKEFDYSSPYLYKAVATGQNGFVE